METSIKSLCDRSAALWAQLQRRRVPEHLGRLLRKLAWTHRQLAREDKALPATASVQAYRRKCLEVLQAENAAAEALLARLVARTFELGALAERQLELSRKAIDSATPVQSVWSWSDGPRLEVALVLGIIGIIACSRWPGLLIPLGFIFVVLVQRTRPSPRLEFRFDGRSLRIIKRFFGIGYDTARVDLAQFNEVVLLNFGDPNGRRLLAVRSPGGLVELDIQHQGKDLERLTAQVREWCGFAKREHC